VIFPGIIDGAVMRGTRGVELGAQCNRKELTEREGIDAGQNKSAVKVETI